MKATYYLCLVFVLFNNLCLVIAVIFSFQNELSDIGFRHVKKIKIQGCWHFRYFKWVVLIIGLNYLVKGPMRFSLNQMSIQWFFILFFYFLNQCLLLWVLVLLTFSLLQSIKGKKIYPPFPTPYKSFGGYAF